MLQQEFNDAAERSKKLPEQSNDILLTLYSLYKQATAGDVAGPRPAMFDFRGRAKFDAWEKLRGMTHDEAMTQYIALVRKLESEAQ